MWFKKRKRSEQDDALPESLRSLQALLDDTDRVEPSLAPRPAKSEDGPDPAGGNGGPPRRPQRPGGEDENLEGRDDGGRPANRWKDLSLSFDAEPVHARPRRSEVDQSAGGEPAAETQPEPAQRSSEPEGTPPPADKESVNDPDGHSAAQASSETAVEEPVAPGSDVDELADGRPPGPEIEIELGEDEYLDTAVAASETLEVSGAGTRGGETADGDFLEAEGASLPAEGFAGGEADTPQDNGRAAETDEPEEDQLDLGLDPVENEHDIPTLTDAVYVPPEATVEPVVQGPGDVVHDERIDRCLEGLRVRLQLMGLDLLSPAQEAELRDTLAELLSEPRHD